jgi:hypothetical protein
VNIGKNKDTPLEQAVEEALRLCEAYLAYWMLPDKKDGKLIQRKPINDVKGNGAAVDNASIIAANGLVIMNSGYGLFGQGPGNVMIAFKPKS